MASSILVASNIPSHVGPYRFVNHLGSGSFAQVYGAVHDETGDEVAVKAIAARKLNAKLRENLECEIRILKDFQHPNIVRLYGIDKTSSTEHIFLVMEFCDGGDLHQFLQGHGCLSESVTQVFMIDLSRGLQFMWSKQYIHRDLKPQNLLLKTTSATSLPTLKIADFGFARHLEEASMAETTCGSPLYMAPEILRLEKYNANADLWSVGAIMFEMLTKRTPFTGTGRRSLLANIENSSLDYPPDITISADAKNLMKGLLKVKPTERLSFEEFLSAPFLNPPTTAGRTSVSMAAAPASMTESQQQMQFSKNGLRGGRTTPAGGFGVESEEFVVLASSTPSGSKASSQSGSVTGGSSSGGLSSRNSGTLLAHDGSRTTDCAGAASGRMGFEEALHKRGLAITHLADSRMAVLHNQVSLSGSWSKVAALETGETVAAALASSLALYARALRVLKQAARCLGTPVAMQDAIAANLHDVVAKSDACRAQAHFLLKAAETRGLHESIKIIQEERIMYSAAVAMGRQAVALKSLDQEGPVSDRPISQASKQAQNLCFHAIYLLEDLMSPESSGGKEAGQVTFADMHMIENLHGTLSNLAQGLAQKCMKQEQSAIAQTPGG